MSKAGDVLLTIVLGILGGVGLLMSLCGATFTVLSLNAPHDPWNQAFLVVSVPSLVVGALMAWFVVRRVRARRRRRATE